MFVRIVLTIACSVAAVAAFDRFRCSRHSPLPRIPNQQQDKNGDPLKKSGHNAGSPQKSKEEEVKRVGNISPSSFGTFQECEKLLLLELDELFEGGLDFHSNSSSEGERIEENGDNIHIQVKPTNWLEERNELDDFEEEEEKILKIFETSTLQSYESRAFELQEEEIELQCQLLEYYGLQELGENCEELERLIREKSNGITELKSHVRSLESHEKKLLDKIVGTENKLEVAELKAKELEKKLEGQSMQSRSDLLNIKQLVVSLGDKEREASRKNLETEKKLSSLKESEVKAKELEWKNKGLELERCDLGTKLAVAEAQIVKLASVTEVKKDVETQGDFVRSLAAEVRAANYNNIDDVVKFVHWLDVELSFLVDEHSVLKHFDWPESKTNAFRAAAFEYQCLTKLENEISLFEDDCTKSCESVLKDMLRLLERVEENVYGLIRTRDMVTEQYMEHSIPTYWLSDSGLTGKIKLGSVQLARKYMRRVVSELDCMTSAKEHDPIKESLLLQAVRFVFRVHQFAGGFDAESMSAFEDLRRRVYAFSGRGEHTK